MNKEDIINISQVYRLAPNKNLGQNFLIDDNIIKKITQALNCDGKRVLEIGPGLGAISREIVKYSRYYIAVEIDKGFVNYLLDSFSADGVSIIHGDFLKLKIDDDFDIIVSNLPYYCASEILFRIAENYSAPEVYCMMQKEMAERIMACPGDKSYGALTVALSYYFNVTLLFHVPPEAFYPKPEVKSSFVKFVRKDKACIDKESEDLFKLIVKSAFWGRRKTLFKSLSQSPHIRFEKDIIDKALEMSSIPPDIRGEKLSTDDYINLAIAFRNLIHQ
ncbi:MAG TPA: 16S rRNA (adenine(1518)-N(6)/adenine(1519)-N(6))-dimethyltransferase RsmA [Spirochaetota bacterium]|nr:ribosomal RNA small subunit methyltransferase A [Spirochaetota bacterium]HOQ13400.1 16S rRNA (adenine(1518)-N(6)/adenine(1519)-N(6))-dimethyltransferase RsmA [Spirochaetota bacterium]